MAVVYKCKMCGGNLEVQEGMTVCECEYCGSIQTVPQLDDEKKINLFTRANRLRSACEFDKAFGVYESIIAEFSEEPEAYWGLVLCKYGIEYVDDPKTGKKIPTCHRSSFVSVLDDQDFDMVMEYSDPSSRAVYRDEAKAIEELRIGIIEVSSKEDPYDIFICYKETDAMGERTIDSVIAQDVYYVLIEKGYKVFFSRITLEDKLGQEYEPYIFAALNSAKIMLVFGTDYEFYNAVWVKNEWSRFLGLIEKGAKKTLIPCYKGIDAYDMPKEFSRLQAQDMGKIGAVQDLVRGIEKILPLSKSKAYDQKETKEERSLLERGNIALEDGDWDKASSYFNRVIDTNPRSADAYLGLALSELQFKGWNQLAEEYYTLQFKIQNNLSFQKAVKFASGELKAQIDSLDSTIRERIEQVQKEWETEKQALIDEAKMQIGSRGVLLAKESGSVLSYVEKQSALRINDGFISAYFSTDLNMMRAVAENPYILIYDGIIEDIQSILPLLEQIVQNKVPLVIFSNISETGEVLTTLIVNKLRDTFKCNAVNISTVSNEANEAYEGIFCTGYEQPASNRYMDTEVLYDIAAYTGGKVISDKTGPALIDVSLDMLGRASEVISDKNVTIIINGEGIVETVEARKQWIEAEKENDLSQKCQEYYNSRLDMFGYAAAIINVGGDDESIVNYRLESLKETINSEQPFLSNDKRATEDWDDISRKLISLAEYNSDCCGAVLGVESKTPQSGIMVMKTGAIINEGFVSPYMITDKKRMEALLDDPYILVTDKKILNIQDILPILEEIVKINARLLIIAEEVAGEALKTLNVNISRGTFMAACINAPKFNGVVDKEYLADLALKTGAYYFTESNGRELKDAKLEDLGRAKTVSVSKHMTVIVGGTCKDFNLIKDRGQKILESIKEMIDPTIKDHYKRRYRELMAKSVEIHVGADTETLMKRRLESILPLVKKRNEKIASDNSSLEGIYLTEEQKKCAMDYYASLAKKEDAFNDFLLMRDECKTRTQQQVVEMKRKREEQEALERKRLEEERQLKERQQAIERQRIEEEQRLIERKKEEEKRRETNRNEAIRRLEELRVKKENLQSELNNLRGLFTKKRRTEIETLLGEIEKEEQRLIGVL